MGWSRAQMASPSLGLQLIQLTSVDSWASLPGPLTLMLLLVGGLSLLQPQGFRSCSRPFSEAFLRGGQITASFPSPLIAAGKGTLSQGSSSHQLESARIKEAGRAP